MRPVSCRTRPARLIAALSAAVAAISFAPVAHATFLTWVNPAGGSWSDAANWSPSQAPGSSDPTVFNLGAGAPDFAAYPGYTVSLPAGVSNSGLGLQIHTDNVTLSEPAASTATLSTVLVAAAASERAALTLAGGGTFRISNLSFATTGTGTLTLTGGSTYNATSNVAASGKGGTAAILADGAGTKMLVFNELDLSYGTGTSSLDVSNGASVRNSSTHLTNGKPDFTSGTAVLGSNGGTAHATVTGPGSLLSFATVDLGTGQLAQTATGTLDLRAGGYAYATTVVVGQSGGTGTVTLDGPGSTLEVTNALTIGGSSSYPTTSHGTVSLSNGAAVAAGQASVILSGGQSVGTLSLATASSFSASSLNVASQPFGTQGSVDVASGSTLTTNNAFIGSEYTTPDPNVNYGVGTVTLGSNVPNTPASWTNADTFYLFTGSVTLNGGGQLSSKTLEVRALGTLALHGGTATLSSTLSLAGTITGAGTVHAPTVSVLAGSPRIAPDGTLAIDANLSLVLAGSAPTLAFDITAPTEYDRLTSIRRLTFGGTLAVSLAPSYAPELGDAFDLLDFASRGGSSTFSTLDLPPLPPGLTWDTSALYTTGAIAVVPEPAPVAVLLVAPLLRRRRRAQR